MSSSSHSQASTPQVPRVEETEPKTDISQPEHSEELADDDDTKIIIPMDLAFVNKYGEIGWDRLGQYLNLVNEDRARRMLPEISLRSLAI